MELLPRHALTEATPQNLMFKSAVILKNLVYSTEQKWEYTVMGATSGGTGFNITPEYLDAVLDGATVALKGAKNKVGEKASINGTFTEITEGMFISALHLVKAEDTFEGYNHYTSKELIEDSDYEDNVALVGELNDGRRCIVIVENAFCQDALEIETKDKNQATYKLSFECHATLEQKNLNQLPYHIYFPKTVEV